MCRVQTTGLVVSWGSGKHPTPAASVGVSDSDASSFPGVGVAGSSHSQKSLVLPDPSLIASSVSAGRDRRSRSREFGESTGDRSRSCPSRSSPSRGRDSCDWRRCARSRSRGSRTGLAIRALIPQTVRGLMDAGTLAVTRHAFLLPVCGISG